MRQIAFQFACFYGDFWIARLNFQSEGDPSLIAASDPYYVSVSYPRWFLGQLRGVRDSDTDASLQPAVQPATYDYRRIALRPWLFNLGVFRECKLATGLIGFSFYSKSPKFCNLLARHPMAPMVHYCSRGYHLAWVVNMVLQLALHLLPKGAEPAMRPLSREFIRPVVPGPRPRFERL